jgi:Holliday junction resolvasome RuvABC endonuclease subunit
MGFIVIGIDPGSKKSGYVVWNGSGIIHKEIVENELLLIDLRAKIYAQPGAVYAVEGVQYFGKAVGKDIFETCYFIGKIMEASRGNSGCPVELVYRKDIKLFLCGTVRAKDKDIRQALIDRLGKEVTRGCSSHIWSALAIAVFYYENQAEKINLEKKRIN